MRKTNVFFKGSYGQMPYFLAVSEVLRFYGAEISFDPTTPQLLCTPRHKKCFKIFEVFLECI